jgi:SHS2 domain-containing protein
MSRVEIFQKKRGVMPYRFLEDTATADTAFEVWDSSIEELFTDAADAMLNVMILDIDNVTNEHQISFEAHDESLEMLLFNVLQELIFQKDTYHYLFRIKNCSIRVIGKLHYFSGVFSGEHLNSLRHKMMVDVKAITLHHYFVKKENDLWRTQIILDI